MGSCYRLVGEGREEEGVRAGEWEELPALPASVCYPAVVVDERRGGVWLIGGMDENYVTRTETYLYIPQGPIHPLVDKTKKY